MAISADMIAYLRCPKTGAVLREKDGLLWGEQAYPEVGGIPWLFADPQGMLSQWRANGRLLLAGLDRDVSALKIENARTDLSDMARKRIGRRLTAVIEHSKQLMTLLKPLHIDAGGDPEAERAFGAKLPMTQGLSSYYDNLHRDWGWDQDVESERNENLLSSTLMQQVLPEGSLKGKMVVLGAGGCRLSYDLHRMFGLQETVNVDINPLLFLAASRIVAGKSVKLCEFPIAPLGLESSGVLRKLSAAHPIRDGFSFLFADAMNPPFADESFDVVLTPWFIDIVPQDIYEFFPRINRILKPGGLWLNLGSTAFMSSSHARRYVAEEVLDAVTCSGFAVEKYRHESIPYMCSPLSCHGRQEKVLAFSAQKKVSVPQPPAYMYLPDWLQDPQMPVPKNQDVMRKAIAHRIYYQVLSFVDGTRSMHDIAALVSQAYGMAPEEALASCLRFFTTMYEEGLQGPLA